MSIGLFPANRELSIAFMIIRATHRSGIITSTAFSTPILHSTVLRFMLGTFCASSALMSISGMTKSSVIVLVNPGASVESAMVWSGTAVR